MLTFHCCHESAPEVRGWYRLEELMTVCSICHKTSLSDKLCTIILSNTLQLFSLYSWMHSEKVLSGGKIKLHTMVYLDLTMGNWSWKWFMTNTDCSFSLCGFILSLWEKTGGVPTRKPFMGNLGGTSPQENSNPLKNVVMAFKSFILSIFYFLSCFLSIFCKSSTLSVLVFIVTWRQSFPTEGPMAQIDTGVKN